MNWHDLLTKGGPIVWVLCAMSVLALAIVLERWVYFLRLGRPSRVDEAEVREAIMKGEAHAVVGCLQGPEARVAAEILEASRHGIADLGRVASRAGSRELQSMERRTRLLGMIAQTTPLVGLLGTISGMIDAFRVIEQAGGKVDAQALAGGIWEAMMTTAVGLGIAIPALFALQGFEGRADRRVHVMKRYASLMIECLPQMTKERTCDTAPRREERISGV